MRRIPIAVLLVLAALALPASASAKSARCLLGSSGPRCYVWNAKVTFVGDGDTIYADIAGDGTRKSKRIRMTGIQAMEQSVYAARASQRRGDCHALEATARLDQLLKASRYRVRLLAQDPASHSVSRLRRSVAVKIRDRWRDTGRILISEGHALWLPNHAESAWNRSYSVLAGRAARAQRNLWDPDYCGFGPSEGHPIQLWVNWDADGNDDLDPNGEWVKIKNPDPVNALPLAGWWLRDSALRKLTFPDWASVPPGGEITVFVGIGDDQEDEFYWGERFPAFENVSLDERAMGDGAYLFDPQGDLRAWMTYPCREGCTDPHQGTVALSAHPRGKESVEITNTGPTPIDLEQYRLTSRPYGYDFAPGTVLAPGATMRVRMWEPESDDADRPLLRYWETNGAILDNGGDSVQLRRYDDVAVACTAWGSSTC